MANKCIFCKSETAAFTTREHILPQSLGGGEWAILPDGLFCDECQNRFGSSIEQQALSDYPFHFFRVFLGIPTKKMKAPWFDSWEGTIIASLQPSTIGINPATPFKDTMERGTKSQIRILAHPQKPDMICRFLLKMGLEVVAADNAQAVFDEKFDYARIVALDGMQHDEWWYLQHEDIPAATHYITRGLTSQKWSENVRLEVIEIEGGAEAFHLKLLYLDFIIPLERQIKPPTMDGLSEPEYRLFVIKPRE